MDTSDGDPINSLMAETFAKSNRTARHDRDALKAAGLLDDVRHGQGGRRQWTTTGVANFLIACACGLPIKDVGEHVPAIRSLPLVPEWCMWEKVLDVFQGFEFRDEMTFGEFIDSLIDDHRRGMFRKFREPGAIHSCSIGINFDSGGRQVLTNVHSGGSFVAMAYASAMPIAFRPFSITRHIDSTIMPERLDNPKATLFEKIAAALGPLDL